MGVGAWAVLDAVSDGRPSPCSGMLDSGTWRRAARAIPYKARPGPARLAVLKCAAWRAGGQLVIPGAWPRRTSASCSGLSAAVRGHGLQPATLCARV